MWENRNRSVGYIRGKKERIGGALGIAESGKFYCIPLQFVYYGFEHVIYDV